MAVNVAAQDDKMMERYGRSHDDDDKSNKLWPSFERLVTVLSKTRAYFKELVEQYKID